jgi:hypothetical protein
MANRKFNIDIEKVSNRKFNIDVGTKLPVTCTDNDQSVEVDFVSEHNDMIRTSLQGIPLNFKLVRENVYVANAHGREFVMKL